MAAIRKPVKTAARGTTHARSRSRAKPNGPAKAKATSASAPLVAPGTPTEFRARVRMYRQGLGDCFLVTFPRKRREPFQILIDCGALGRDKVFMTQIVEHIRDSVRSGSKGKARLDVVVATHEHKDHLSGFNQARTLFDDDFEFGSVWLGWTENLTMPEVKKLKETKRKAVAKLHAALASPRAIAAQSLAGVDALLNFSRDEDDVGTGRVSEAIEYLKRRGKVAGDLRYLEPGMEPFELEGVEGVRVYVLGPPRDPTLLKTSEVTERMKREGVVYHLSSSGEAGMDALGAALTSSPGTDGDRYHPFSQEHRIPREVPIAENSQTLKPNPYFAGIRAFVAQTYDKAGQAWRRIDDDWLTAFGQLALDLDNDTNNTCVVLAFEFEGTREVLLFVGDAQVGSWQSWAKLTFRTRGRPDPVPAHDLLARTVFYKVGHHSSHNATLKAGGLELMNREDLVAFIPLDEETARNQGTKGWEMPAPSLFKALQQKTGGRVVISDVKKVLTPQAAAAGILSTGAYVDYFLK